MAASEAMGKLIQRGQIANPVTLKNLFDQDGALAEIGGAQYLVQLAQSVVTVINAEDYGHAIHDLFLRRQLIDVGQTVVNEAYIFRRRGNRPGPDRTGGNEALQSGGKRPDRRRTEELQYRRQ